MRCDHRSSAVQLHVAVRSSCYSILLLFTSWLVTMIKCVMNNVTTALLGGSIIVVLYLYLLLLIRIRRIITHNDNFNAATTTSLCLTRAEHQDHHFESTLPLQVAIHTIWLYWGYLTLNPPNELIQAVRPFDFQYLRLKPHT
jgi:Ca2+/H+ antiporter